MASYGSSLGFGGELTPATTPRRGARSIYTPSYAASYVPVPPTTPTTWSHSAYYNALPNLYPYSQDNVNRFTNPSRHAVGASSYGLNNYNYQTPISVADVQRVIADLVVGRAPRPATPVGQAQVPSSPDDIVINGVKYVKSTIANAKKDSNTSTHAKHQPPTCESDDEGDDLPGPSRTKGKGRADVWDNGVTATEADTFNQAADTPRAIDDCNNTATTADNWGPSQSDVGWDNQSAAGTVDDPIHVPGFSDDFLVSVLVGTSAIHELKVLKSTLVTILADPKFSDHKDALDNDQSIVLQGIASDHFQRLVRLVYAGYPDTDILHVMKHFSDAHLVELYAAGHHFGLQDLCQEVIYVLETRDTSIRLFDLVQQVYSDGHADEAFRGLVRTKIGAMLDLMDTSQVSWSTVWAPDVKETIMNPDLPSGLREDALSVLFDREVARINAKKSECAATQTDEHDGWGYSRESDVSEETKDEKSIFVTGFPASYKSLDIVNEVMFNASATSYNPDVDFQLLRRDDSLEGRYLYVTFSTPEAAIAAFEDLIGKEMGFGANKKAVFVDFAFDDVTKNFKRFGEWMVGVYP